MADNQQQKITREFYNELVAKKNRIEQIEIPDNSEKLKAAREQGDLSENAEYAEERERQGRLQGELKEINYILENAIIIDGENSVNNLGKHITVIYEDDNTSFDFQLIGAAIESDPLNGKISIESPLGRAVLEANVGSRVLVKPEQGKEFTVVVTHIGSKK